MANWLQFDRIAHWDALALTGFAYDHIPDTAIEAALADPRLPAVNADLDWEDDRWLAACPDIPDDQKHAYRVAALVRQFQSGRPLQSAIWLDTFCLSYCQSGVSNGHHRIRALQYLDCPAGPFVLSGYCDALEDLVRLAGCPPPAIAYPYVAPRLFELTEDDTTVPEDPPPQ